jgi:hypothetical protein
MKQTRTHTLIEVFVHYGSMTRLAKELGLTLAAVSAWDHVPMRHLARISKETGIPRQKLRPDLYEDN